jgi:hypothetical protein
MAEERLLKTFLNIQVGGRKYIGRLRKCWTEAGRDL